MDKLINEVLKDNPILGNNKEETPVDTNNVSSAHQPVKIDISNTQNTPKMSTNLADETWRFAWSRIKNRYSAEELFSLYGDPAEMERNLGMIGNSNTADNETPTEVSYSSNTVSKTLVEQSQKGEKSHHSNLDDTDRASNIAKSAGERIPATKQMSDATTTNRKTTRFPISSHAFSKDKGFLRLHSNCLLEPWSLDLRLKASTSAASHATSSVCADIDPKYLRCDSMAVDAAVLCSETDNKSKPASGAPRRVPRKALAPSSTVPQLHRPYAISTTASTSDCLQPPLDDKVLIIVQRFKKSCEGFSDRNIPSLAEHVKAYVDYAIAVPRILDCLMLDFKNIIKNCIFDFFILPADDPQKKLLVERTKHIFESVKRLYCETALFTPRIIKWSFFTVNSLASCRNLTRNAPLAYDRWKECTAFKSLLDVCSSLFKKPVTNESLELSDILLKLVARNFPHLDWILLYIANGHPKNVLKHFFMNGFQHFQKNALHDINLRAHDNSIDPVHMSVCVVIYNLQRVVGVNIHNIIKRLFQSILDNVALKDSERFLIPAYMLHLATISNDIGDIIRKCFLDLFGKPLYSRNKVDTSCCFISQELLWHNASYKPSIKFLQKNCLYKFPDFDCVLTDNMVKLLKLSKSANPILKQRMIKLVALHFLNSKSAVNVKIIKLLIDVAVFYPPVEELDALQEHFDLSSKELFEIKDVAKQIMEMISLRWINDTDKLMKAFFAPMLNQTDAICDLYKSCNPFTPKNTWITRLIIGLARNLNLINYSSLISQILIIAKNNDMLDILNFLPVFGVEHAKLMLSKLFRHIDLPEQGVCTKITCLTNLCYAVEFNCLKYSVIQSMFTFIPSLLSYLYIDSVQLKLITLKVITKIVLAQRTSFQNSYPVSTLMKMITSIVHAHMVILKESDIVPKVKVVELCRELLLRLSDTYDIADLMSVRHLVVSMMNARLYAEPLGTRVPAIPLAVDQRLNKQGRKVTNPHLKISNRGTRITLSADLAGERTSNLNSERQQSLHDESVIETELSKRRFMRDSRYSKYEIVLNSKIFLDTLVLILNDTRYDKAAEVKEGGLKDTNTDHCFKMQHHLSVQFVSILIKEIVPDVLFNSTIWPDIEVMKHTMERDLLIQNKFADNPILWSVMLNIVSHDPSATSACSPVIRSLLSADIRFWTSTPMTSQEKLRPKLDNTLDLIEIMRRGRLIEGPLSYIGQIIEYLEPFEITILLTNCWDYIRANPTIENKDTNLSSPYTKDLKLILISNISTLGKYYNNFFLKKINN